ncbi:MAG: transglycosylase domain-containing protein [Cyanobacteriota bacterium]|nr:transglycosylase domain-containing protein [Cyanobacteriota bacterium]
MGDAPLPTSSPRAPDRGATAGASDGDPSGSGAAADVSADSRAADSRAADSRAADSEWQHGSAEDAGSSGLPWQELGQGSASERMEAAQRLWHRSRQRRASLELWHGDTLVCRLPLGQERLRIGRDPDCELVCDGSGVSRIHAVVEKDRPDDRDWVLEDFNSANGLYWHDRRIRAIRLRHGDTVQLGSPLGDAPTLRYVHPRSPWERLVHGVGLSALIGSGVVIGALLALSTISGGSRVDFIGGPVKIVAGDGRRIDAREGAATALPTLEDYPLVLRQALIASEDSRFGWNSGLDVGGTLRSLVQRSGGGSGITQQVARLYYPWVRNGNPRSPWPWVRIPEDDANPSTLATFARKLRELPVSWQLETRFDKNRILKMYLDRAYLGLGTEGFEEGAQLYFRKSARQLDASEAAYLVGLLPSPNGYNVCAPSPGELRAERLERERRSGRPETPLPDEQVWTPKLRRDLVLGRMHAEGFLSREQYRDALRRPLSFDASACRASRWISYPFFSDYALWELEGQRFSLNIDPSEEGGNYHVVATIDPELQARAQRSLRSFLETRARPIGVNQAALITLAVPSGRILAYVGGGDYRFDRVQSLRQPGSTFKLFTYLTALEQGIGPGDTISCAPIYQLETGCAHGGAGGLSMADGLAYSENPVALHLADRVGFDKVIGMARRLGISSPHLQPDPSMVLGGNEVLLYEMARAFAVVANGGRSVPMHGVSRIYDLNICGSELALAGCPARGRFEPLLEKPQQLLSPEVALQMDAMLRRAVEIGTGRPAGVVGDARGKTGTTNDGRDAWFIGYSPSQGLLTGIWMGNDDSRPAEASAGAMAAELWGRFMRGLSG